MGMIRLGCSGWDTGTGQMYSIKAQMSQNSRHIRIFLTQQRSILLFIDILILELCLAEQSIHRRILDLRSSLTARSPMKKCLIYQKGWRMICEYSVTS